MSRQTRHRQNRPTDRPPASTDNVDRPRAGTPRHLPSGVAFVLALGVVLAALAVAPALSPVGTASAVQCADDEVAVEVYLLNDGLGTTPPSDIYYTIIKNGGTYDGIVENGDLEELGSSPYLIVDLSESQAGAIHKLTACYTEGLPHEVQLELEDGSELVFSPGIEDELIWSVEGGVQAGTIEKNYINTNHIGVRFQTTLRCSADERKIELEFGGGGGTYTAFVDGTEIRVEDNSLENGVTETRQMCFDYGDSYTVEQKGDYTDHGTLPDPEIMDVKYLDSNGNYVYLGRNDDISATNPNARVTFTLNRRPTADATKGGDTFGGETSIVEGQTDIAFDGTDSSDPDGNALSYTWAFGDGTTATGATTTHDYAEAVSTRGGSATFSPDLTVDDGLGKKSLDTDSDFATITVYNDMDGDGLADTEAAPGQADDDDDNDGIPDSVEAVSTSTTDLPAGATTVTVGGTTYPDSDGDGYADLWDTDSDGDGITDSVEATGDSDGDGTADYRDTDSDGDGVPDADEGTTDGDGDGVPAFQDASPRFTGGADMSTIDEDPTSNAGTTVLGLLGDVFNDTDGGKDSLAGAAVTADGATADEGTWQYSTNSGTTWHAVESVSPDAALLLDAATKLRFVPAKNYNGDPGELTVFAVDDGDITDFTDGDMRRTVDTTADDALSPVSPSGVRVGITVDPVNDAPTMSTDARSLNDIGEDETGNGGTAVAAILDSAGTTDDVEGDTPGVAITGVDDTDGTWEYSTDGGSSWSAVSSASPTDSSALLLTDDDLVRFVPTGDFSGNAAGSITLRAWDGTSRSAGDTTTNGGTTAYSSNTAQASITVLDAPEVSSITRASPSSPTDADSVDFEVTFTEPVSGVDDSDFSITQVSGDVSSSVASVDSGSGTTITVTGDSITGDGNLRLDLNDDDSITNGDGVSLGGTGTSGTSDGSYSRGETFSLDNTAPSADATNSDTSGDEDAAISFAASASTDNDAIASYEWDWTDDGTYEATGESQSHTYADPGEYTVRLRVTDDAGNTDTDTVTVTVEDTTAPTAEAGADRTVEAGVPVTFYGTRSSDNDRIASYDWEFGDGGTSPVATPAHTYTETGTYTVELTVTDDAGNTDTDTATVLVEDTTAPTADAGVDRTIEARTGLQLDGTGSSDNVEIVSYEWDLGDGGNTIYSATATHFYQEAGTYTVTLTVTDTNGLADTDSFTVTVQDTTRPVADAGPNRTVATNESVSFDGTGSSDDLGVTSYEWDFGDNSSTVTGATPTHTFDESGNYTVTLTVADGAGNTDTDTVTVTVEEEEPTVPTIPGATSPPTSIDDDSLLEDVDGDGDADVFDVMTYYNNAKSDTIRNNTDAFDFDGDGHAGTVFDALALYDEIS